MLTLRKVYLSLVTLILSVGLLLPSTSLATVVRMETALGAIDIQLFDEQAPLTVANFLGYVDSGAYVDSVIHRSVAGFVIQGGGYTWDSSAANTLSLITTAAPVLNEFSASRSNLRGTIAMAKVDGDPDSATSQWFFNLADNSRNLDNQNGGFTVFGQVIGQGMKVIDSMVALPIVNAGSGFEQLPILTQPEGAWKKSNLLTINAVSTLNSNDKLTVTDADRVFAYLEAFFPEFIAPAHSLSFRSTTAGDYYFRYYSATQSYVGTDSLGKLYYLGPASNNQFLELGTLADWLTSAHAAGY